MVKKRLMPLLAVVGLAVVATSCGSDGAQSSPASDSTLPPVATDDPATGGYTHPTGVDDVVISYAELGGFTTPAVTFQQTPAVLVSGDGRVFSPGAQIEIYPGPLLPAVQVQTITETGIQNLLAAADDAGLLADIDYTIDSNVADASTATVVISADGNTWTHEAYALGFAGPDGVEPTPERQALLAFVTQLTELSKLAGAENLGETSLFEPTEYAIEATPVDDLSAYGSDGIEPTLEEWPSDVSVRLVDASSCVTLPASEVGDLLASANQLTFFTDADVTYQVVARPVLPGSTC
jgi:hypothetical protein